MLFGCEEFIPGAANVIALLVRFIVQGEEDHLKYVRHIPGEQFVKSAQIHLRCRLEGTLYQVIVIDRPREKGNA